jgi:hypothetical protein
MPFRSPHFFICTSQLRRVAYFRRRLGEGAGGGFALARSSNPRRHGCNALIPAGGLLVGAAVRGLRLHERRAWNDLLTLAFPKGRVKRPCLVVYPLGSMRRRHGSRRQSSASPWPFGRGELGFAARST